MNATSVWPYTEAVLELLPYAIPVLRDRLGPLTADSKNPTEPSEVGPGRHCPPHYEYTPMYTPVHP